MLHFSASISHSSTQTFYRCCSKPAWHGLLQLLVFSINAFRRFGSCCSNTANAVCLCTHQLCPSTSSGP